MPGRRLPRTSVRHLAPRLALAILLSCGWTVVAIAAPAQALTVIADDSADPGAVDAPADTPLASDPAVPSGAESPTSAAHATADDSRATDPPADDSTDTPSQHASADNGLDATDQATGDSADQGDATSTDEPTDEPTDSTTDEPSDMASGEAVDDGLDPTSTESPDAVGPASVSLNIGLAVGEPAAGAPITVDATDLLPGSELSVWIFSSPRLLASEIVADDGTAAVDTEIPGDLEPGDHTVVVKATASDGSVHETATGLTINADGLVTALQSDVDPSSLEIPTGDVGPNIPAYAPVNPLDTPAKVASASVAALTLATVAGAVAGAGAMRSGGSGHSSTRSRSGAAGDGGNRGSSGGSVDASVRERGEHHIEPLLHKHHEPARVAVELASASAVLRRFSPLSSRIVLDAAPIRAFLGTLSLLLPLATIVLGLIAGLSVHGVAQPAALSLMLPLVVISVFDALAGVLGAVTFAIVVTASGGIVDISSVRTLIGILIVIIGPGLIGGSFRDIRRAHASGSDAAWERLTDLVVVPLLGGFTAIAIVSSLPGLGGRAFPIAQQATLIGVVVIISLVAKVILEEFAARNRPQPMAEIGKLSGVEPETTQRAISALLRTGMFLFISAAFVGNVWQLWVTAALFLLPGLIGLLRLRWPNLAALWQVLPVGVPLFTFMLIIGVIVTAAVTAVRGETPTFAQDTFLWMAVPGFLLSLLALVAHEPKEGDERWYMRPRMVVTYRVGGVVMLLLAIYLATRGL